jgi:DNA polymerase-3 subunit gamma/tau
VGGATWRDLVDRVRAQRPALASVLEHGCVLRFEADGVELGFPADTFYWDSARDADNRELVASLLREQFGQAVRLTMQAMEGGHLGDISLAEAAARQRRERLEEIREGALNDPVVRSATQILGGEVEQVTPLVDELEAAD